MALVTVSDIETYMDIDLDNKQEDAAQFIIDGLESELVAYLRRPVSVTSFTETYRVPEVGRGVAQNNHYHNYTTDPSYSTTLSSPGILYTPTWVLYLNESPVVSITDLTITPATASGNKTTVKLDLAGATNGTYAAGDATVYYIDSTTDPDDPDVYAYTNTESITVASNTATNKSFQAVKASKNYNSVANGGKIPNGTGGSGPSFTGSSGDQGGTATVNSGSALSGGTDGATAVAQVAETDYIKRKYGVDLYNAYANDTINITYTAGLDGANIKAFKILILRAAAREMQNMYDDTVGLKDLTTRDIAPLETGFTERELASIKRYRRVRVS
tara:strand:- start:6668 stop:7657 length:990 start_codon:yes stop_codon:yes gene_type:complete